MATPTGHTARRPGPLMGGCRLCSCPPDGPTLCSYGTQHAHSPAQSNRPPLRLPRNLLVQDHAVRIPGPVVHPEPDAPDRLLGFPTGDRDPLLRWLPSPPRPRIAFPRAARPVGQRHPHHAAADQFPTLKPKRNISSAPTVRINGVDVEPDADTRHAYGLMCRVYPTDDGLRGTPPDAWITAALQPTG
jgi:hypothetical protein